MQLAIGEVELKSNLTRLPCSSIADPIVSRFLSREIISATRLLIQFGWRGECRALPFSIF